MKKTFVLFFLFSSITFIFAQKEEQPKQLPSLAIGGGILTFSGDVGSGVNLSSFSKIRGGYTFTIEQRIKKIIGVSLTGIYGKMADSESSKLGRLNFESPVIQGDLNLVIHLDNDLIFKRNSSFAPYLFSGIGFLKFDPHGDLKSANGKSYNYWSDGTIKDKPENDPLAASAVNVQRDYDYETQLKDTVTNYSRSTLVIPVGGGVTLKINEHWGVNFGATYYFALSDWLDNKKAGSNDRYLFANASLKYTFGREIDNSSAVYEKIDFSEVDKIDTDGDGINDGEDRCAGTPKGIKVNAKGCPDDLDEDGVPDYKDKELKTKKGAYVDENGKTITEATISKQQLARDSIATERSQLFNENPSLRALQDVEAKAIAARKNNPNKTTNIPLALQPADKDKDGYIRTDEITSAIEAFFEGGDTVFTAEKINDLIDFFFEQ
jgi:hypothetical protein